MRGDLDRAGELHARALAICRDLGDVGSQPNMLCGLGHVRLGQGEMGAAEALGREAVEISELIGNRLGTASGLELIGLARLADDPAGAARVLAAADSLRVELGAPPEVRDRDRLRTARDTALDRLPDTFEEIWRAGRAASTDAVVASVLGSERRHMPKT